MRDRDFDYLLQTALRKGQEAPDSWKRAALERIKIAEEKKMERRIRYGKRLVMTLIIVLALSTGVYAGFRLLQPQEAALLMDRQELAESFRQEESKILTETDGNYTVSLIGILTGKQMDVLEEDGKKSCVLDQKKTYAVAAIQRTDGKKIEDYQSFYITPLIEGLDPMKWNGATLGGSWECRLKEGVLYYIAEWDDLAVFGMHQMYIAVIEDAAAPGRDAFTFDEQSGKIQKNETYKKTNLLLPVDTDKSFADAEKAAQWIAKKEAEWAGETETDVVNLETIEAKEKGITVTLQEGRPLTDAAADVQEFAFHLYIEGKDIESVGLAASHGKLLQPKEITKVAYEKEQGKEYEGEFILRYSAGQYFAEDWSKAAESIEVDWRRFTGEMRATEALKYRIDKEIFKEAKTVSFLVTVVKKDGSRVEKTVEVSMDSQRLRFQFS